MPVATAEHRPTELAGCDGRTAPLAELAGTPVGAFCGIGNPAAFRRTLDGLGATVADFRAFPDHHAYTRAGVADLARWAESLPAGAVLATLNVLMGFASIEYSRGKSTTVFFKVVLGGMGVRLLVMALLLVGLITVLRLHVGALIGSLGVLYAVFLALEVMYIQKKVSEKS